MSARWVAGILVSGWLVMLFSGAGSAIAGPGTEAVPHNRLESSISDVTDGSTLEASSGEAFALLSPGLYPRYGQEDPVTAYPLHAAALHDDAPGALRLIEAGMPVDARDREWRTPLMVAAAFGSTDVAELLLAHGADPRARDRAYGDTPLHFAALAGRIDVAEMLLAKGAAINVVANLGERPLHYAALYNHRKMIAFLVAQGAEIDAADGLGLTALQYASRRGRLQAAGLLRDLGARQDSLLGAVSAGDLIRVRELLRGGADPNESDASQTALHLAAARGYVAIAAALLDGGAEIEAEGEPAQVHPLHVAAFHDRSEMVAFLISRGAVVDARDAEGRTPLIVAAVFGAGEATAEALLDNGADPEAIDTTWNEAVLHYAAIAGNVAIAAAVVSRGANVNKRSLKNGVAPMHRAAGFNKLDMIEFLAAQGAQLSPVDRVGRTPYANAICDNSETAAALLLKLGAPK